MVGYVPLFKGTLLRDGIDVYLGEGDDVTFVYLATRQRVHISCSKHLTEILPKLNGKLSLYKLLESIEPTLHTQVESFLDYLRNKGIVVNSAWFDDLDIPLPYKNRLERFANFLLDIVGDEIKTSEALHRLYNANVAIVGVGAVGSWMVRILNMIGFRRFILIDGKISPDKNNIREAFAFPENSSRSKAELIAIALKEVDPHVEIIFHHHIIEPKKEFLLPLEDIDLLVNAADEPYIGYINTILCRIALRRKIPFFAAGGFDAHLGCHGELTVLGEAPCTDCYTSFFRDSLADWKPVSHPVADRTLGFGGLPSLAAYSASHGALIILRHFLNFDGDDGGRAEFLFRSNGTDRFKVKRDPFCRSCGPKNNSDLSDINSHQHKNNSL
jgi:molybdopterin-synthase adenylyltransferase